MNTVCRIDKMLRLFLCLCCTIKVVIVYNQLHVHYSDKNTKKEEHLTTFCRAITRLYQLPSLSAVSTGYCLRFDPRLPKSAFRVTV